VADLTIRHERFVIYVDWESSGQAGRRCTIQSCGAVLAREPVAAAGPLGGAGAIAIPKTDLGNFYDKMAERVV
jgi:hypothetical protein